MVIKYNNTLSEKYKSIRDKLKSIKYILDILSNLNIKKVDDTLIVSSKYNLIINAKNIAFKSDGLLVQIGKEIHLNPNLNEIKKSSLIFKAMEKV